MWWGGSERDRETQTKEWSIGGVGMGKNIYPLRNLIYISGMVYMGVTYSVVCIVIFEIFNSTPVSADDMI